MKHFGDITKISGYDVPAVDIITGGSPCQDLSIAGSRSGLKHSAKGDDETTRSGLFMEQIRIIKEMRDESRRRLSNQRADFDGRDVQPRYMVWENVCGAFSSGFPIGEDFRIVLEETARIANSNTTIPRLPTGSSWSHAGVILGDGWSLAWRVHDAQFWGVPQRRKRISLVADFGGQSAPPILFERQVLSGNSKQSEEARKETSCRIGDGIERKSEAISFCERAGCEGGGKGILIQHEKTGTLSTLGNQFVFSVGHDIRFARFTTDEITDPIMAEDYRDPIKIITESVARRITPLEAERLQGFPDLWTDIGEWVDSHGKAQNSTDKMRIKALGNSIALPFWEWMAGRMCDTLRSEGKQNLTMASLFDGIGGFPLVYSRCGCEPVWASEIEEFPIAVTKVHFPEK